MTQLSQIRHHEAEQAAHEQRVRALIDDMKIEMLNLDMRSARAVVLNEAIALLGKLYDAPHRHAYWVDLDSLLGADLALGRKAVRELVARNELVMKGATKGPAATQVRMAHVPPYAMV